MRLWGDLGLVFLFYGVEYGKFILRAKTGNL